MSHLFYSGSVLDMGLKNACGSKWCNVNLSFSMVFPRLIDYLDKRDSDFTWFPLQLSSLSEVSLFAIGAGLSCVLRCK